MIGLDRIVAQELSDTIGATYDCALDPHLWPDACRLIANLCESTAGGICVHDLRYTKNDQLFVFGYQQQFLGALAQNYAQSPMAASDIVANVGDVKATSYAFPRTRHHRSGSHNGLLYIREGRHRFR